MQPWGSVLIPPQRIHITLSFSSLQNSNPQQMESVSILHFRLKEQEKLIKIRKTRLKRAGPAQTLILSATPPLATAMKLLTQSSWAGTHSFQGQEPPVSPFVWHSNKAILLFTQNPGLTEDSGYGRGIRHAKVEERLGGLPMLKR